MLAISPESETFTWQERQLPNLTHPLSKLTR